MAVHLAGVLGLVAIFAIGTARSINLGVLAIVIAGLGGALLVGLLLCYVGAVTSAFASSAAILGALIPLAVPFMARGRERERARAAPRLPGAAPLGTRHDRDCAAHRLARLHPADDMNRMDPCD